ncbi:MAG: FAD-dependent oxidoreductase [Victivallales bacterium]|nr:FAD-dependent oxidoreductase [Victivallales bacterium]
MKKYDLIVCGGGIAGCAAALAAARRGVKTALVEKTIWPGGLATSGLVLVYLPICDGHGHQEMFGITEELLKVANQYGPVDVSTDWKVGKGRYQVHFSPAAFVLALDELLEKAGVDVWLDTLLLGAERDGEGIATVTVANKSGILKLEAKMFVDATGDADLSAFAGEQLQLATNSLVTWVVEHREAQDSSAFTFGEKVSTLIQAEPINNAYTEPGVNGRMVSTFVLEGRRRYRQALLDDYASGREDRHTRYPMLLPTMPPLRHTRCAVGKYVLDNGMREARFPDCIGMASEWRGCGLAQRIPYRALLPLRNRNLLLAGRCISSINDAWELTRVIPAAALTGEVAGIAAALSLKANVTPDDLPFDQLAGELKEQHFLL